MGQQTKQCQLWMIIMVTRWDDVEVTGVKVGKVSKMKLNWLALENLQLRGENGMEEMKICRVCFCHKCQQKREMPVLQSGLNLFLNRSQAHHNSAFDTNVETELRKDIWKEFRNACSANWK
jgi:hypothetical protein